MKEAYKEIGMKGAGSSIEEFVNELTPRSFKGVV